MLYTTTEGKVRKTNIYVLVNFRELHSAFAMSLNFYCDSNLGDRQFHEFFFIKSIKGERNVHIYIFFLIGSNFSLALLHFWP